MHSKNETDGMISIVYIIGVSLTVALLLAVSWWSGRKVKDARSFMTGGNAGSLLVGGALLGTLAGGQSTIGTAQLAFCYGWSAWWFTIGAGIGAAVLGLVYAAHIRKSGCSTLLEIVGKEYGKTAETVGSLLSMIGIFISIVAQVLAAAAMISTLFSVDMVTAAVAGALLIMLFVLFGGIKSAGVSGLVKMLLLFFCSLVAGGVVLSAAGGFEGLYSALEGALGSQAVCSVNGMEGTDALHARFGSLFARGVFKDMGGCLSLILGVLATQTYAQCIWSARTDRHARRGALICAACIPLIGAACTLVGIYMRGHYVTEEEMAAMRAAGEMLPQQMGVIQNSAQAFPAFIQLHLPAWLGGIMLGTLLVNVIGCGSGLSLGAATILVRDVFDVLSRRAGKMPQLMLTRCSIVAILAVAVGVALVAGGSFINDLGFLSLGLRAVAILFPLSFALWCRGAYRTRGVLLSMVGGTAAMLIAKFTTLPGDAVYYGLAVALGILLAFKK